MLIPSVNHPDSYFNSQIQEKPVSISNKYFIDIPNSASLKFFFFPHNFSHAFGAWAKGKGNNFQYF